MIKRAGGFRLENAERLKDGRGTIEILHFFEPEDFGGMGRLYGISIIKPGDSIGRHQHKGEQEAYYILEGEACYDDNGVETILKPGDLSICRDGESHAIENKGTEDLKYIALISYIK